MTELQNIKTTYVIINILINATDMGKRCEDVKLIAEDMKFVVDKTVTACYYYDTINGNPVRRFSARKGNEA